MRIKLLKPHRHAGVNYSVGDTIDVTLDTANYLAELKVATPTGDSTPSPTVKSISQEQPELPKGRGTPAEVNKGVVSIPTVNLPVDHAGDNQPVGVTPQVV